MDVRRVRHARSRLLACLITVVAVVAGVVSAISLAGSPSSAATSASVGVPAPLSASTAPAVAHGVEGRAPQPRVAATGLPGYDAATSKITARTGRDAWLKVDGILQTRL